MKTRFSGISPLAVTVLAVVLAVCAGSSASSSSPTAQQKFAAGGLVRMHLEAGDYTIQATDSDEVKVTCSSDYPEKLQKVRVDVKTSGTTAQVYVRDTPHNNFHVTIEVPRRSGLWVRLSAGDMKVEDIEGDKDIETNAGDLTIQVPHPELYGHSDASVWAGDISASAFAVNKSGLFRSFHQSGPGKYRLHVHLLAGDLRITTGT
jgi:hypothetical protein